MLDRVKPETINGLNIDDVKALIESVRADSAAGATRWSVTSQWRGRTHNQTKVSSFQIGGVDSKRDFTIDIDEPAELGGANQFANPQEYLMAAMNSCMMVGYVVLCSLNGIHLDSLEIETAGDIDLQAFLGLNDKVTPGYESLEYTVRIRGDATEEKFAEIHETVMKTSPNFHNISRAVKLNGRLQIV